MRQVRKPDDVEAIDAASLRAGQDDDLVPFGERACDRPFGPPVGKELDTV